MNQEEAHSIIKRTVLSSIGDYARKRPTKEASFQLLDLIIPEERKIRSIVGGMETSLGTTLWEPLAKALAGANGFLVHDADLQCPANMPSSLNNALQSIYDDRVKEGGSYDAQSSHDEIKRVCQAFIQRPIDSFEKPPSGRGVDIWLEKDEVNFFFDTKTVQPNLRSLKSYLEQLLYWYAYFYSKNPTGQAVARIVFPYNPHGDRPFWEGVTGKGKPLEPSYEAWVENEFWDFCSGVTNTYEIITQSVIELKESRELEVDLARLFNV